MIKKIILKTLNNFGYSLIKNNEGIKSENINNEFYKIYELCKPYTMTSLQRMNSLYNVVRYIIKYNIPGDFVECGVYKGGSCMLIAKYLQLHNITDRKIYMFDTFEGMTEPGDSDISIHGENASETFLKSKISESSSNWCYSSLEEVKENMRKTGFSDENIILVKGKVEDTLPNFTPQNSISLLRLDTDWYESTLHELIHLYPKLEKNGVLILDDYGHWAGSKKAVLEYFRNNNIIILLNKIDEESRIGVKTI